VALGVSDLFSQARNGLKCWPRHLHLPRGRPGWCHILTEYGIKGVEPESVLYEQRSAQRTMNAKKRN